MITAILAGLVGGQLAIILRMQRRLRQARADLRWEQVKRNQAREFAADAEIALQAMAERHHELECVLAGVPVGKSIWVDGVRIPVDDADEDDLELGQPLIQTYASDSKHDATYHGKGYDWKQEMP